ncbi:MAG: CPBP family intramembrane metalloprotease [Candidatus Aenigmarchaeota archaeon]|nr:CPBP family intramembrane metalloprotease [Candidatus Aenigmarchaeota archaeon]
MDTLFFIEPFMLYVTGLVIIVVFLHNKSNFTGFWIKTVTYIFLIYGIGICLFGLAYIAGGLDQLKTRFFQFLQSISTIGCIILAAFIYLKIMFKRFEDDLKSVDWVQKNVLKVTLLFTVPLIGIWAPFVEEMVYRAPLILVFQSTTIYSWIAILVSSAIFGIAHWSSPTATMFDVFSEKEEGALETDDSIKELKKVEEKKGNVILRRVINVISGFTLGILCGYYGIKYQSIWVAVGIHVAWNLLAPVIIGMVLLIIRLIILFVKDQKEKYF